METVGTITVIVAGIIIVGGVVVGVVSMPDIRRYLRMRAM